MRNLTFLAATAFMFCAATAFASGSGGSGNNGGTSGSSSGGSSSASPATHNCKSGEVWDKKKLKCLKATGGILPDQQLFEQGRALAKNGDYDWALTVLAAAQDQTDPRILTYEGYSNRKAGRFDIGMGFYQKALAINPDYVTAREYLGEGLVSVGKVDLAKQQLGEIGKRCGTQCEEYKDLAEAIASGD